MEDPKTKPEAAKMEVLVLGMCRTGTMSMTLALQDLGYPKVYHFSTLFNNPTHIALWEKAMTAKFPADSAAPDEIPAELWDEILGSYSALTDLPGAMFAEELTAAYPHAKLILLTRPSSTWHASMLSTINALHTSRLQKSLLALPFMPQKAKDLSALLSHIVVSFFQGSIPEHGIEVYEAHSANVRRLAREQGRELLEMEIQEGWEPLCAFLGKEVPEWEFPKVNDSETFRKDFKLNWEVSDRSWEAGRHVIAAVVVAAGMSYLVRLLG